MEQWARESEPPKTSTEGEGSSRKQVRTLFISSMSWGCGRSPELDILMGWCDLFTAVFPKGVWVGVWEGEVWNSAALSSHLPSAAKMGEAFWEKLPLITFPIWSRQVCSSRSKEGGRGGEREGSRFYRSPTIHQLKITRRTGALGMCSVRESRSLDVWRWDRKGAKKQSSSLSGIHACSL